MFHIRQCLFISALQLGVFSASALGAPAAPAPPSVPVTPALPSAPSGPSAYEDGSKMGNWFYTKKDYAAAIRCWQEAYQSKPSLTLIYNIAQAYRKLKDYAHAEEYFLRYLDQVPAAQDDPTTHEARARLDEVQAQLRLTTLQSSIARPTPSQWWLRKPRWQLGLGIAGMATSLGLLGWGIAGLAYNGKKYTGEMVEHCPVSANSTSCVYDTAGYGGAVFGVGLALGVASSLVFSWPPKRAEARSGTAAFTAATTPVASTQD